MSHPSVSVSFRSFTTFFFSTSLFFSGLSSVGLCLSVSLCSTLCLCLCLPTLVPLSPVLSPRLPISSRPGPSPGMVSSTTVPGPTPPPGRGREGGGASLAAGPHGPGDSGHVSRGGTGTDVPVWTITGPVPRSLWGVRPVTQSVRVPLRDGEERSGEGWDRGWVRRTPGGLHRSVSGSQSSRSSSHASALTVTTPHPITQPRTSGVDVRVAREPRVRSYNSL